MSKRATLPVWLMGLGNIPIGLSGAVGLVTVPQLMAAYDIRRIGLLKVDIEGSEFAVFGKAEDLRWLDRVDQVVLEVHRDFGDVAALVGRFRQHGFAVDLRDNAGTSVPFTSDRLDYAYFSRS